jgi:hypothetical protein
MVSKEGPGAVEWLTPCHACGETFAFRKSYGAGCGHIFNHLRFWCPDCTVT